MAHQKKVQPHARRRPGRGSRVASASRVLLAALVVLPRPLLPATITVTGTDSSLLAGDGVCSLREAINNANSNSDASGGDCAAGDDLPSGSDTIELTVDVTLDTVDNDFNGPNGLPSIDSTIEIQGNDSTIRRDPAAEDFRIFLPLDGNLTIHNTTISGGDPGPGSSGGGIAVAGPGASLTLINSTLSGNSGGGIFINGYAAAYLTNSTLSGNSGGGMVNDGTATLTNTTLVGNTSVNLGGGIFNFGTAVLANSTLSGNEASSAAAIFNYGTVTLSNSTLVGNSGAYGGALYNGSSSSVYVENTILANSAGGGNCDGAITDNGGNLDDDLSCGFLPATVLTGVDPTPADNGGPTMTHALLPGSNAINGVGTACSATDQRGAGREGLCDIGAFEFLTCTDPGFFGTTVTDTQTRTHCQDFLADDFSVASTGDLTLLAGRSLEIRNFTSVETGGVLTLAVDTDLQIARTVFVTSIPYLGDLEDADDPDGLAGADAKCQDLADAADLPGTFKAWLSDSACGPADGCRSFTQAEAPYYRLDGVRVADDWTDLTDGSLKANIDVDEFGQPVGVTIVWTSTSADGSLFNPNFCTDWTSSAGSARVGCSNSTASSWSDCGFDVPCNSSFRLYCFEQ